jgi:hypothetical protein
MVDMLLAGWCNWTLESHQRLGALNLQQWWKGYEWLGGCGWRFGVNLRLDGDAD